MDPPASSSLPHRPDRYWQVVVGLRSRPQGLPRGFSVLYKRASRLFTDLAQARGEGRLPRLMTTLERTRLLIIDDWGPEPLNAEQRRDLLEIVDDRYDRGSLLVTSQLPANRWHEVIGDPPWLTPFSTASSIAPIASTSKARRCAGASSPAKAPLHDCP